MNAPKQLAELNQVSLWVGDVKLAPQRLEPDSSPRELHMIAYEMYVAATAAVGVLAGGNAELRLDDGTVILSVNLDAWDRVRWPKGPELQGKHYTPYDSDPQTVWASAAKGAAYQPRPVGQATPARRFADGTVEEAVTPVKVTR